LRRNGLKSAEIRIFLAVTAIFTLKVDQMGTLGYVTAGMIATTVLVTIGSFASMITALPIG